MIPTSPRDWNNNIYTRFGIRPIINCRGVFTYLTASLELPQVRKAVEEASHFFIDFYELHAAVGRYLAKMSGAESGMITSGSAGSISAAVAGCIAGSDPKNIYQLPDTTGMKGEVIIMGGRSAWDSCIRLTGAKLIVAPTVDDLNSAITSQTAMIYTTWHDDDRMNQILKISKPAGVPLMVDQAAGIPPYSNFTRYAKLGVDLFCFSGGKGLMGPQVSGLLLGRKDLIDAALYNCVPWEGAICRPMKVGKEEIMGCLAALDYWSKADCDAINKEWQRRMERLAKMVETVPGVHTSDQDPAPHRVRQLPHPHRLIGTNRSSASRWLNATSNCVRAILGLRYRPMKISAASSPASRPPPRPSASVGPPRTSCVSSPSPCSPAKSSS